MHHRSTVHSLPWRIYLGLKDCIGAEQPLREAQETGGLVPIVVQPFEFKEPQPPTPVLQEPEPKKMKRKQPEPNFQDDFDFDFIKLSNPHKRRKYIEMPKVTTNLRSSPEQTRKFSLLLKTAKKSRKYTAEVGTQCDLLKAKSNVESPVPRTKKMCVTPKKWTPSKVPIEIEMLEKKEIQLTPKSTPKKDFIEIMCTPKKDIQKIEICTPKKDLQKIEICTPKKQTPKKEIQSPKYEDQIMSDATPIKEKEPTFFQFGSENVNQYPFPDFTQNILPQNNMFLNSFSPDAGSGASKLFEAFQNLEENTNYVPKRKRR